VSWKSIRVGQIIKLKDKDEVPADILLLSSSYADGKCYIETSNIDGETNLKVRKGVLPTQGNIDLNSIPSVSGFVTYDEPNSRIYDFTGSLHINNDSSGAIYSAGGEGNEGEELVRNVAYSNVTPSNPNEGNIGLGPKNILLRGCSIRNTKEIIGLVLYTGRDTKLMQKGGFKTVKFSNLERVVNRCIIVVIISQVVLSIISTIGLLAWNKVSISIYYYYLIFINIFIKNNLRCTQIIFRT
jgi:phospholipid-transporting ATPase